MDRISYDDLASAILPARLLREIRVFPELPSTNTYIREECGGEAPGLVVVTDHQSAGRGREGRVWVAPPGGSISCSVLLEPNLPASELFLLTAACALAIQRAISPLVCKRVELKWPNDVLIAGLKVSGILAEAHASPRPRVIVGFGVNVHYAPCPEVVPGATSVAAWSAAPITRAGILGTVLRGYDGLLARLEEGETGTVWEEWRAALGTIGREVEVRGPDGPVVGRALDVARDGALLVETRGGVEAVYAGNAIERLAQSCRSE